MKGAKGDPFWATALRPVRPCSVQAVFCIALLRAAAALHVAGWLAVMWLAACLGGRGTNYERTNEAS